jgi:flavin prenyltransferase
MNPIVLAITGASGAPYAVELLRQLTIAGRDVLLSISPSGAIVLRQEVGLEIDLSDPDIEALLRCSKWVRGERDNSAWGTAARRVRYCHHRDFMSPPASGSFLTGGMIVCPCSGGTLSAIASGASMNLIQRAAEVHLKERRKLILVPRETPLSIPTIDNMRRVVEAGGIVLPASPGWYHHVDSPGDLISFVVARILDQLGVEHTLMERWGE